MGQLCSSRKDVHEEAREMIRKGHHSQLKRLFLRSPNHVKPNHKDRFGWSLVHEAASIQSAALCLVLSLKGARTNISDSSGWSPLHVAISLNHDENVQALIQAGADVNRARSGGRTALHDCVVDFERKRQMVQWLVDAGASFEKPDDKGVTPLNLAAKNGHEEALLFLLVQTNNVNAHIPTLGCSALHFAAQRGSDRVATELLAAGASVDAPSASTGFTPLMYAASAPVDRAQSTVNLLLDAGASVATIVQTKSQSIRSPLVAFIDAKKFGIAEQLIRLGAPVNVELDGENIETTPATPLGTAVSRQAPRSLVELLLAKGAQIDAICNDQRETPLIVACRLAARNHALTDKLVRVLVEHEANVCAGDANGSTALHCLLNAPIEGSANHDALALLLAAGANPNARNNTGATPLHTRQVTLTPELLLQLTHAGAQINVQNSTNGFTPLHTAAAQGDYTAVHTLVHAHADIHVLSDMRRTALDEARPDIGAIHSLLRQPALYTLQHRALMRLHAQTLPRDPPARLNEQALRSHITALCPPITDAAITLAV